MERPLDELCDRVADLNQLVKVTINALGLAEVILNVVV